MFDWITDWFWDFVYGLLYGISKSMYYIIDNLMACANMLVGIDPIQYQGQDMDFLTFLLRNKNISFAFTGSVIVAIVLVMVFAVAMIIRSIASEKIEKTPAQIAIQAGKTLLTFLFIPAAMMVFIYFTNIVMKVLYSTTTGGSPDGIGRFLAGSFGQNGLKEGVDPDFFLNKDFNYRSTSQMKQFVDLSDYDYFFSWIACIVIIISIGLTLLMFIDRAISIVILFIVSPISLASSVLDDGARFKLWRDSFLTKFLTGYGCIISINIYALIVVALADKDLIFFSNQYMNYFAKILIIVGGGVSMTKIMALIGNLIAAGAGSNELRDTAIAAAGFGRVMGGAAGLAWGAAKMPWKAYKGAYNLMQDASHKGAGTAIAQRLGLKTERDYRMEDAQLRMGGYGSGNKNASSGANMMRGGNNAAGNIIGGGNAGANNKNNLGGGGGDKGNKNDKAGGGNPGGGMVNNAVNNALGGDGGGRKRSNSMSLPRRK